MSRLLTELFRIRFLGAFAVFALFAAAPIAVVWASKGDLVEIDQSEDRVAPPLVVTLGKAELVDVGGDVSDVLVANPSVVDVMAVQANKLYIVGVSVGDTNLMALDANGDIVKRIDVHVSYDLQAIQSLVDSLFPNETVKVSSIHDQILLTGTVSTPESASKIANIVGHYVSDLTDSTDPIDQQISNLLDVRGEQQVMLQVKIIEATRSVLKEIGIETNFNDPVENVGTLFYQDPPTVGTGDSSAFQNLGGAGIALSQDPATTARLFLNTGSDFFGMMGTFINALEEENLINVLAEPNLTAVSGEQAGFLAGGEFPVPVGRDTFGNITVEFRQFGVSLNFRPIVLSDERISLLLNTEVSSLDFENAVVLADVTVPGLDVRRAETTVEIASGSSLMIAGLMRSDAVKGMSGLPGISKAPVIGDLVSSDSFQRDETELVVIVTPYLVQPYAEKDRSDPVPDQESHPLASMFAVNIRRSFDLDEDEDEDMFSLDERYGYLLD